MSCLLDTCALLWAARQPRRLSRRIQDLLLDTREDIAVSVVSAWEISLKPQLGISDAAGWFRAAADKLQARVLPVRLEHIAALQRLPVRHRDPFDRLLLAQALATGLVLITPDDAMRKYEEVRSFWE
jgi:PIN domain nuclease of toxin-antitoxin system